MTSLIYIFAFALLGQTKGGIVELNCSDNATCIDHMAKEFARSLRQQKTIKLFDLFTIEPLGNRQARSSQDPLTRLITTHAISFDWNDFTFRFSNPEDRSDALDLEVFEGRSVKDVSDEVPKKSKDKEEEDVLENKKGALIRPIKRRRHRRKVMQAVVPLLFGMKSAGVAIFALFMVSVITIKAFLASKMALMVTVGMAMKKLYESYGGGVGLQNHPYLYSQYPIDFPSASSHAYSVSGVSQQFATPEMYSPTGLGGNTHTHELISNDASAQQSQQAPQVLNSTRAAERWDGKSKLLKYLEPVVDTIRSFVDPIASVFYTMPRFRGLTSDISTAIVEPEVETKRPREFLVPQPRNIAQRKMHRKSPRHRPKKYVEFKVDLEKLKYNKDFLDYIKTKKYKYNYPQTYYYPRIKYFVNPNTFTQKPNYNRLLPYRKPVLRRNIFVDRTNLTVTTPLPLNTVLPLESSDWKPIIKFNTSNSDIRHHKREKRRRKKHNKKRRKRVKRSLDYRPTNLTLVKGNPNNEIKSGRGFFGIVDLVADPFGVVVKQADEYKKVLRNSLKSKSPPKYYTFAYNMLMLCLDAIDGLFEVHEVIHNHLSDDVKPKRKTKKKIKKKKPIKGSHYSHKNATSKVNYDKKFLLN